MAVNNRLTSFELGNKIKSLLEEKRTNAEIINETQIGQSQLTNYKRVIALGKLEELSQGKPLNDIVKENKGIKIKKEEKTREQTISHDIERNLAKNIKKEQDKINLSKELRERIEHIESLGLEAMRYEYFSEGTWQLYIPYPKDDCNPYTEKESVLRFQNHVLRFEMEDNLARIEKAFELRLERARRDCKIQKRRNNELNAQLSTLIFTEKRTPEESIVELHKEIADLKRQLLDAKKINKEEVEKLIKEETRGYQEENEYKDLEIKTLKEMLHKCETERRTAVHKNTKKYLVSMADHWEKKFNCESGENGLLRERIIELEKKLKEKEN